MDIKNLLAWLGVTRSYKGYQPMVDYIAQALQDEQTLQHTTKQYAAISKAYGCKENALEKNMRTVVKRAWETHPERVQKLSGYDSFKQPTITEFVDMCVTYLLRNS